jgi:hypothetical protein
VIRRVLSYLFVPLLTLPGLRTAAQDSLHNLDNQLDLVDLGRSFLQGYHTRKIDTIQQKEGKVHTSILPAAGYTLQTGFAGVLSSNFAFFASPQGLTNLSTVLTSLTYSEYHQIIFPIQADIWTKGNGYNIVTDWRYLHYPSVTYGLGGNTPADSGYNIDYGYLRLHQAILRALATNLYGGLGYDLDYFWNIRELDPPTQKPTDFERYGLTKNSVASGPSVHLLYDSRHNPINPEKGDYLSLIYHPNFTFLGSDNNWASLVMDARKYIPLPEGDHNVLAFWSYDWFTLGNGHPPYLLLPSTGWDPYSNTGRGYIQGRYRSLNMLYLESEYRFGITCNGLLGGVVFANAQSFTQPGSDQYTYIQPGYGLGLRISLNKFSRTNLCIDYGWGTHGSQGFFVNLGEVF